MSFDMIVMAIIS